MAITGGKFRDCGCAPALVAGIGPSLRRWYIAVPRTGAARRAADRAPDARLDAARRFPCCNPVGSSGYFPSRPSIAPAWTIPARTAGFCCAGRAYLGERNSLASLDFLGEDRLLFTFRVPAPAAPRNRETRAIPTSAKFAPWCWSLPSGTVEAETNWLCTTARAICGCSATAIFCCATATPGRRRRYRSSSRRCCDFPGPLLSDGTRPRPAVSGHQLARTASRPQSKPARPGPRMPAPLPSGIDTADTSGAERARIWCFASCSRDSGQVMLVTPGARSGPFAHQRRGLSGQPARQRHGLDGGDELLHRRKPAAGNGQVRVHAGFAVSSPSTKCWPPPAPIWATTRWWP